MIVWVVFVDGLYFCLIRFFLFASAGLSRELTTSESDEFDVMMLFLFKVLMYVLLFVRLMLLCDVFEFVLKGLLIDIFIGFSLALYVRSKFFYTE